MIRGNVLSKPKGPPVRKKKDVCKLAKEYSKTFERKTKRSSSPVIQSPEEPPPICCDCPVQIVRKLFWPFPLWPRPPYL